MNRTADVMKLPVPSPSTARVLLFLAATSVACAVTAPTPLPDRLPHERYEKLRSEPFFAVATAVEKPVEKEQWAQNLYLGSAAKRKTDGVDEDWVIIKDRTQPGTLIQLTGSEPKEGYQLVKLEWSEDPRKTKAQIKKGTEFATVEMDQAAFTATSSPQVPPRPAGPGGVMAPGGARPGMQPPPGMPQPGGMVKPTTNVARPSVPQPSAQARPPVQIPRPTNLPPALPQATAPQPVNPNGTAVRSRVRVIPSKP
jgi:hypothetical protein